MIAAEQLGDAVDLRSLFVPYRTDLCELLESLSAADWQQSTVCPGWSVADIVAHVLGDDLGRLGTDLGPEVDRDPRPGEPLATFLDRHNEQWVASCRGMDPSELHDRVRRSGDEVAAWWSRLDPDAPSIGVSWAGIDPAPVWFDAARDLTEYWLHEQQIREAIGAPLRDDPPTLRRMLDVLARGLPHALAGIDGPDDGAGVLRTSGALEHRWVLRRGDGRWWMVGDEPTSFNGSGRSDLVGDDVPAWEVLVDANDLWRRWIRHPDAAELHVRTAGDEGATTAVLDHVAIIRSPGS